MSPDAQEGRAVVTRPASQDLRAPHGPRQSSGEVTIAVELATVLLAGPGAVFDRLTYSCDICGYMHVGHIPVGAWRRQEPIVRAPRCAPHRQVQLKVVNVVPATAVAGQRKRGCGVIALLDAAISYAEDGLLVLPLHWPLGHGCSCRKPGCEHPGKHPLGQAVPNGKDSATRDADQIRTWWQRWPSANIGIRPAPGMAVLDIDPRNDGHVTLHELQMTHGGLPETLTATTGSGGAHVWYAAPKVTVGKLGAGIDVKTERGYLVAAPSVHASGGVYRWTSEAPIVEAPRWLHNLLAPPRPMVLRTLGPRGSGRGDRGAALVRTVAAAEEGNRNNLLWWAARKAHEEQGGDAELLSEIRQAAIAGGQSATAVDATIRSAEQWVRSGGRR